MSKIELVQPRRWFDSEGQYITIHTTARLDSSSPTWFTRAPHVTSLPPEKDGNLSPDSRAVTGSWAVCPDPYACAYWSLGPPHSSSRERVTA